MGIPFNENDLRGLGGGGLRKGTAARLAAGTAEQAIDAEGLDSCLIIPHRVKKLTLCSLDAAGENP
jgi:hypothetical protein